jgi:hypothetical protein
MINMADRIAKPVVKNKFWVVEDQGHRVATIQATVDGGFVYVHDDEREHIPSLKVLKQKYNIKFGAASKPPKEETVTVYGYPMTGRSYKNGEACCQKMLNLPERNFQQHLLQISFQSF